MDDNSQLDCIDMNLATCEELLKEAKDTNKKLVDLVEKAARTRCIAFWDRSCDKTAIKKEAWCVTCKARALLKEMKEKMDAQ